MANYQAVTVSEGGKVKDLKAVQDLISNYSFGYDGELTVEISETDKQIYIYGYDGLEATQTPKEGEEYTDLDNVIEEFLQALASHLETTLIVKEVGFEKCRYVNAFAYIVKPNEKVQFTDLDEAINQKLTKQL